MKKQRVFITGATGTMGLASLKKMLKDSDKQDIVILSLDTERDRKILIKIKRDLKSFGAI